MRPKSDPSISDPQQARSDPPAEARIASQAHGGAAPATPCRTAHAELGGRAVRVRVRESGSWTLLAIEDHGAWTIDRATGVVKVIAPPPDGEAAARVLNGPIRLLAMAERGLYVLHAAAIASVSGGLVVLTAPSGVGKSTFAAVVAQIGRERAADDLLPVSVAPDGTVFAHPHFEQPKLSADAQYPPAAPSARVLTAIVSLERAHLATWTPLSARAGMDLILRATVATRIYPKLALAAHLDFCRRVGAAIGEGRLACGRLTVPDRPEAIETAIGEALSVLDMALSR